MIGLSQHIHLDPVGGIAGDMFIAAILDALPELEPLVLSEIAAILPPERATASLKRGKSRGMAVQRFQLSIKGQKVAPRNVHDGFQHGHPDCGHSHTRRHSEGAPEEDFRSLAGRIEKAAIATETRRHALGILTRIAEVESRMHAVPLDQVHFHELADWDSLADVVGAGAIFGALVGTGWSIGALPLGGGTVSTTHGVLPVPAPATAALLEGLSVTDDGLVGERVTPTGAAIAAHLYDGLLRPRPSRAKMGGQGMGAGTRELADRPNILRALVLHDVTIGSRTTAIPGKVRRGKVSS